MNIKFISEIFGLLTFEEDLSVNKKALNNWPCYKTNGELGSFRVRTQKSSLLQVYLIEIDASDNDFLHLKFLSDCKNMLVFVFLNSLSIHLTNSKKKLFHDRSCNLITNMNDSLGLSVHKNHKYAIILICFSSGFLKRHTEIYIDPKLLHNIYPAFYYSRSVIVTKEAMDLLSVVFLNNLTIKTGNPLMEEISGSILTWFIESNPSRLFQPNNLILEDAEDFYKQKNNLLNHKHKNTSYASLLHQAGIKDVYSFRRRLKQLYGLNIRDFITEARLADAVSLLKESDLSVKEIAFKTGFVNAAYFSRIFTNYFGLSPKQLRQHFLR